VHPHHPCVTCSLSRWLCTARRDRTRNALVRAAARPLFGLTVKRTRNMSDFPMRDVRNRKVAGDSHSQLKPLKRPSVRARARDPSLPFALAISGFPLSQRYLALPLLFISQQAAAANKSVRALAARNNLSRGDCTL
jgi:hypothetical protein